MLQRFERDFQYSHQLLARTRRETAERYALTTCAEYPELVEASTNLENEVWDDLSFLDYTSAHHAYYDELLSAFPDYRLCMIDLGSGELVATGMCVPLRVSEAPPLPVRGWDWIVETVHEQGGRNPNTIAALSISVPEEHRHKGIARDMISAMRGLAAMKFLPQVIAPVRPSAKCKHQLVPMDQYLEWSDSRGRLFDPWLRSHVAAGGRIESVCSRSMVVEQPIEFWRTWTDGDLDRSGEVLVDGALAPVHVDTEAGMGRYVEPNVWIRHAV